MMNEKLSFLLVEDDAVDVMTVRRAMADLRLPARLGVATDGEEALYWLRDSSKVQPDIILLDLNMPRMNGIEFLRVAKRDPHLKLTPVVVMTTSREEQDRLESFSLGVAGYMLKPVDYSQFIAMLDTIYRYWTLSELPGSSLL